MVRVIFGRQIDIGASPALFRAPTQAPVKPVMVVVDESDGDAANAPSYRLSDRLGRLTWRGDAVQGQRTRHA